MADNKRKNQKVHYTTEVGKKGTYRIKHWTEIIIDQGTGEPFELKRSKPIKLNGQKLVFYSDAQIRRMTPQQRQAILI